MSTDSPTARRNGKNVPIRVEHEGRWVVISIPKLDLATQGRNEKEAEAYLIDLIQQYLADPDVMLKAPHWRVLDALRVLRGNIDSSVNESIRKIIAMESGNPADALTDAEKNVLDIVGKLGGASPSDDKLQKASGLSRNRLTEILNELAKHHLLKKERRGKRYVYAK